MFVFMGSGRGGLANELLSSICLPPRLFVCLGPELFIYCFLQTQPSLAHHQGTVTFRVYGGARSQVGEISIKDEGS